MSKVRIICMKVDAPSVIRALHNQSILHLKDFSFPETIRSGPLPLFDDISARTIKIKAIKEAICGTAARPQLRQEAAGKSCRAPRKKIPVDSPLRDADGIIADSEKFLSNISERDSLHKELDAILSAKRALDEVSKFDIDFSKLASDSLQFSLIKVGAGKEGAAKLGLAQIKGCAFTSVPGQGGSTIVLVATSKQWDAKQLEQFGQALPFPSIASTPAAEIGSLGRQEAAIREKISAVDKRIGRFIEANHAKVMAVDEALSIEADRAQAATMFGASASLYFMEGWVEKSRFNGLSAHLREKFGKKVFLTRAGIGHDELPPTKLDNPKIAAPFQFVVEFLSTTNYREIDPSIILAITIPLIYALIFGDAGYAILSFIMAFLMMKNSKPGSLLNEIATIWAVSAIPAFLFGLLFDEYFGFTHTRLLGLFGVASGPLYVGLHRVSLITTLMLISIIVGMAHLALGFILGAINDWGHSKKHAIAKLCWLGIEMSGFFLVSAYMFNAFTFMSLPALALFVLCAVGLFVTEGAISLFEIPSLASNIMSYIRIAAVGVGGVILAEAINELLLPRLELSPLGILVFIITAIIYVAFHAVACIIAMFEAFVHGTRLNVVEFFGKFYKGDGRKFVPFRPERVYSQEQV